MHFKDILQSLQQGILICNKQAKILYFNEAYGEFIGQKLADVVGRSITRYRKHTMVPEVIESKTAIEGVIRQEGQQVYYASIYPIIENDGLQGTISIVTTLDSQQLKVSLKNETLEERVRKFEEQEILAEIAACGSGVEAKKKAAGRLGISLSSLYSKIKE